jgi:hypothetical protein
MKKYKLFIEDEIEGGLADQYTCEQIANKHNVPLEDIMNQLYKGIEVEMEHTDDKELAKEIAKDHLTEYPYYYDELEKMEKKFENNRGIIVKSYKRKFRESAEYVPYRVYGEGELKFFTKYFIDRYNKKYGTMYSINGGVNTTFEETKMYDTSYKIFVKGVSKGFDILIEDVESDQTLYMGHLVLKIDFSKKDVASSVTWEAVEFDPKGKRNNISFIFKK